MKLIHKVNDREKHKQFIEILDSKPFLNELDKLMIKKQWILMPYLSCEDISAMIKHIEKSKMKCTKKEITNFLKSSDIGSEVGDFKNGVIEKQENGDSIVMVENAFSKRDDDKERESLKLSISGVDEIKDFSLSPTNYNKLIDILGGDSEKWIGKEIGLVLTTNPMQKDKLMILIRSKK